MSARDRAFGEIRAALQIPEEVPVMVYLQQLADERDRAHKLMRAAVRNFETWRVRAEKAEAERDRLRTWRVRAEKAEVERDAAIQRAEEAEAEAERYSSARLDLGVQKEHLEFEVERLKLQVMSRVMERDAAREKLRSLRQVRADELKEVVREDGELLARAEKAEHERDECRTVNRNRFKQLNKALDSYEAPHGETVEERIYGLAEERDAALKRVEAVRAENEDARRLIAQTALDYAVLHREVERLKGNQT